MRKSWKSSESDRTSGLYRLVGDLVSEDHLFIDLMINHRVRSLGLRLALREQYKAMLSASVRLTIVAGQISSVRPTQSDENDGQADKTDTKGESSTMVITTPYTKGPPLSVV
jgi:hypothetical protein